jgi:hypothetical protein
MFEVDRALVREAAQTLAAARGLRWVIGGACSGKSSVCQGDRRHGACSGKSSVCAWVLSLPWETFDDLNRATNAEFLDLVARDVAERYGDRPVLVDGGITHPSVLAAVVDPARIACLAVDDAESRRIWQEDEARSGMRRAVERLPGGAERWATFLTFNERMSATIEREAREQGVAVFARTAGVSVDELSEAVMGALGIEGDDGSATGRRAP